MQKKVLSIDIDFLFPDSYMFNPHIQDELSPEKSWKAIELFTGTTDYEPCPDALEWLTALLTATCKKATVDVIRDHEEILPLLQEKKVHKCQLVNVDFHHDITYHNDDSEATLENWVMFGRHKNIIKDYIWIHQDTSEMCVESPIRYIHRSWKDVPLDYFEGYEFDHVALCVSPHFTPIKYHYLVMYLKGLLAEERICDTLKK